MGRRVCRSGTVRRAYAGKSDQRGNKGAIRGHTRRASSTGSFGAVRGGRRTRQGDARQRWTGAVQHAKRLYPRIETAHIAISRYMRVNLTTGMKGEATNETLPPYMTFSSSILCLPSVALVSFIQLG
jgi:hypothetical protein